jgi:hypothetical protein
MKTLVDDLVGAVKASDPSEDAVWCTLEAELEYRTPGSEPLLLLGCLQAAKYKYIDTHVRVPQHQRRAGRKPDTGGASKAAAIQSFVYDYYKREVR